MSLDDIEADVIHQDEVAETARRYTILDDAYNVRLAVKDETSPLYKILAMACEDAKQANLALIVTDPFKAERVRDLQWRIQRYHDLVGYANAIVQNGKVVHEEMTGEESEAVARMLGHEDQQMKDV
jgi:hypothetical protein